VKQNTEVQRLQLEQEQRNLMQIAQSLGGDVEAPSELHPRYQAASAMLDKAQNDLQHVNVYAPNDGVVTKVVEKGQYIVPGSMAMMLVSETNLWIEANLTETDMTYVRAGQEVEIAVDYAPNTTWKGKVESLSPATGAEFSVIPAQNATGNWVKIAQRLPVRISIDPQDNAPQLRAGLSAEVSIDTQHQRHVAL
jgi:membrane fusion protein (multidrug efflux system)